MCRQCSWRSHSRRRRRRRHRFGRISLNQLKIIGSSSSGGGSGAKICTRASTLASSEQPPVEAAELAHSLAVGAEFAEKQKQTQDRAASREPRKKREDEEASQRQRQKKERGKTKWRRAREMISLPDARPDEAFGEELRANARCDRRGARFRRLVGDFCRFRRRRLP